MKCFVVMIILCIIGNIFSQQIDSLNVISLIAPQVDFLEDMCFNRTENNSIFEELKETMEKCQATILNGTEMTLLNSDPKEFYNFYMSQCNEPGAIEMRDECNKNFKFILKQCLNETELQAFNKIEDIAMRMYKVICEMDKEKMKNFFSAKGQECLGDNVITIGYCFLSALPDDDIERQNFLFKFIEGKECQVIDVMENCMMGELDVCDEKSISHIFKLFFQHFKNELNCKDSVQEMKIEEFNSSHISKASTAILLTSFFIAFLFSGH